nr:MAG TPA: hypothetical protein [Caudoviricetes sp.]
MFSLPCENKSVYTRRPDFVPAVIEKSGLTF